LSGYFSGKLSDYDLFGYSKVTCIAIQYTSISNLAQVVNLLISDADDCHRPDDRSNLRNVGKLLPPYTVQHHSHIYTRRRESLLIPVRNEFGSILALNADYRD
jgi:hypothetical protein